MTLFYGVNPSVTSPKTAQNPSSLGIFTKSHVIRSPQGIQRLHDFLLQDQSAKLLPKERVCNCLKNRIDKYKPRDIKYSESRKKPTGRTFSVAVLSGHVLFVPSKLQKSVVKN